MSPARAGRGPVERARAERALALHLAERALAVLLLHDLVQLARLVDVRATCGGNGGGTLPCAREPIANFICLIEETMPCVFGTSSVSRSQPVVSLERTNHFACFAPMSRSIAVPDRLRPELRDRVARVDALRAPLVAEIAARAVPDAVLGAVVLEPLDRAPSRGSPTKRIPLASAAGPRNSGSDSIELHSETQQPQLMQSASLWMTHLLLAGRRYSFPSGGSA